MIGNQTKAFKNDDKIAQLKEAYKITNPDLCPVQEFNPYLPTDFSSEQLQQDSLLREVTYSPFCQLKTFLSLSYIVSSSA